MGQKVDVQCPSCEMDFAQDVSKIESYKLMECPQCGEQFYYFPENLQESLEELKQTLEK